MAEWKPGFGPLPERLLTATSTAPQNQGEISSWLSIVLFMTANSREFRFLPFQKSCAQSGTTTRTSTVQVQGDEHGPTLRFRPAQLQQSANMHQPRRQSPSTILCFAQAGHCWRSTSPSWRAMGTTMRPPTKQKRARVSCDPLDQPSSGLVGARPSIRGGSSAPSTIGLARARE